VRELWIITRFSLDMTQATVENGRRPRVQATSPHIRASRFSGVYFLVI
jgi:hypothetical protein